MADKIRANYPAMQSMAKQMDMVNNRLTELVGTFNKISQQMQGGVLLGAPGDNFVNSLTVGSSKVSALANKFAELSKDINAAISDMQAADTSAAGDFK